MDHGVTSHKEQARPQSTPSWQHAGQAAGAWFQRPLVDQLGNTGSEVSRAQKARDRGDREGERLAFERSLELFDLTLADPRHRGRLKEIARLREAWVDFFVGDNRYATTREQWDETFLQYAIAARAGRD